MYIGSFWNQEVNPAGRENAALFAAESHDLLEDLRALPQQSAVRKINELVKRTRLAKVHALLVSHLRSNMPMLWGHKKQQSKLAMRLTEEYKKVQKGHNLAPGDFPSVNKFRSGLDAFDLSDFPSLSRRLVDVVDGALARDIPKLMLALGANAEADIRSSPQHDGFPTSSQESPMPQRLPSNPFPDGDPVEFAEWDIPLNMQTKWENVFKKVLDDSGKGVRTPSGNEAVSGSTVRALMLESGLPPGVLKHVWDLSDVDQDGLLDREEFAVAMHLIKMARDKGSNALPQTLPLKLTPPSKRHLQ